MGGRDGDVPDLFEYAAQQAKRARKTGEDSKAQEGAELGGKPKAGSRDAPLTVSELTRRAGSAIERAFGTLWAEGEIASLSRAASGHLYFVLKDDRAEVRGVMWRSDAQKLKFRLQQGMAVLCRVRPTIYEQGGKFQIYASAIEPAGLGAEALALEQLKKKLASEGLFEASRKKVIPRLPGRIGVVTSKSGAAVRDIIRATHRRFPVPILLADAVVQGESAATSMVRALKALSKCDVDVIIIGRGGGSSSDLSAFNDERLVRAVAACPIPTISAVGHEVDVSLCDLVADRRAATPTMAGEMAVPVLAELEEVLEKEERRLRRELSVRFAAVRQQLDRMTDKSHALVTRRLHDRRQILSELRRKLDTKHPKVRLVSNRAALEQLEKRSAVVTRQRLDRSRSRLAELAGRLDSLSPLRVLDRGYALATHNGVVLKDAGATKPGDELDVRLARGVLRCVAKGILPGDPE